MYVGKNPASPSNQNIYYYHTCRTNERTNASVLLILSLTSSSLRPPSHFPPCLPCLSCKWTVTKRGLWQGEDRHPVVHDLKSTCTQPFQALFNKSKLKRHRSSLSFFAHDIFAPRIFRTINVILLIVLLSLCGHLPHCGNNKNTHHLLSIRSSPGAHVYYVNVRSVQQQEGQGCPVTINKSCRKSTSRAYTQYAGYIHPCCCARTSLCCHSRTNLIAIVSILTCSSSPCFPLPPPPPCLPAPCLCSCSSSSWRGMFSCCCAGCSRERLLLLCELVVDVKAVEIMLWAVRGWGSSCFFGGGCFYRVFRRGG